MEKVDQKLNITLIDDNAIFRLIISNMAKGFEQVPTEVTLFENAIDAIASIEKADNMNNPDILLVDISMPYMSGWEFMDKLKSLQPSFINSCDIYILSSSTSKSDRDQISDFPFVKDYVTKPIEKEHLFELFSLALK